MLNSLLIISDTIKYNPIFLDYIERKVKESVGHIDFTVHLNENDKEILLTIQESIQKSQNLVIVTKSAYPLICKILSTISDDTMVMREGILTPSKAKSFTKESVYLTINGCEVNLIKADSAKELPKLQVDAKSKRLGLYLFDVEDFEIEKRLMPTINAFEARATFADIIKGLIYVELGGLIFEQRDSLVKAIERDFEGRVLFGDELSAIVAKKLIEMNKKVTTMESCTGGLVASELVKHSGVSSIYNGSVVSYANSIKMLVGVKKETLEKYGAVSMQTVYEMLDSIMRLMKSDIAIAISGIAGPTGGTLKKPVGLVYVGVKNRDGESFIEELRLKGDRIYIQKQAMFWVFKLLVLSDRKNFFKKIQKTIDN